MSAQETLTVIWFGVFATAAWASVFLLIPWCLQATFRHRVWKLRDALYDEIRHGRLPNERAVCFLLSAMETTIRYSSNLSFLRVASTLAAEDTEEDRRFDRWLDEAEGKLSDEHKDLYEAYLLRLFRSILGHALLGTPSGWMGSLVVIGLSPILVPIALFRSWRDRVKDAAPRGTLRAREEFSLAIEPGSRWRAAIAASPLMEMIDQAGRTVSVGFLRETTNESSDTTPLSLAM